MAKQHVKTHGPLVLYPEASSQNSGSGAGVSGGDGNADEDSLSEVIHTLQTVSFSKQPEYVDSDE